MDTLYMASFGEMLRFFRKQQGITQKQLAARIGVHTNTVWAWERGDYLPDTKGLILETARQLNLNDFEARQLLVSSLIDSPSLPYWSVPYQRNPFFVGRQQLISHLHQRLQEQRQENHFAVCALSGMGGIGKTQVALAYAYFAFQEYAAVFWINAANEESIHASFAAIASVFRFPQHLEAPQGDATPMVIEWLHRSSDWLLIIDGLEDVKRIKPFLPAAPQGTLLFTTRLHTLGTLAPLIEVEPLSFQESAQLLLRRTHAPMQEQTATHLSPEIQTLAAAMDGLPLALDQVASYIEQTHCHLKDVLRLFEECPLRLLNERDPQADYAFSVVQIYTLAFEKIQKEQPGAAELLFFCCFFAPDEIPEEVVIEYIKEKEPSSERGGNPLLKINALFKELLTNSLIHRFPQRRTIRMHRLVQTVIKGRLPEAERGARHEQVLRLFYQTIQQYATQTQGQAWPLYESILPHTLYCLQQAKYVDEEPASVGFLLARLATYLFHQERFQQAEKLYQHALPILQRHLEPVHTELVLVRTNLRQTQDHLHRLRQSAGNA